MYKIIFLALATVLLCSCTHAPVRAAHTALTRTDMPETPAATRALELLSVINLGKRENIKNYLAESASAALQDEVDFFLMVHSDTLRLVVQKIEKAGEANSANFLLNSELTDLPMNYSVTVNKEPPYKIASFNLDFAQTVEENDNKISLDQAGQELTAFFNKVCQADMFSGAVLLAKNDRIIFQSACGEANKDFGVANKINTKFNLGSMNKMFTAVAIAQLVEQGKLSLDDPLSKFMPDFPDKKSAKKIKISHLLSHSSGLGNYFNDKYNATPKEQLKSIDDFFALLKAEKLAFEPGSKWQYSNIGFLVLGKIIEILTHKSYFDYINEHIYSPAVMHQSGSFDLTSVNKNLAVGYNKEYTDSGYDFSNNLFRHVVKGGPAGGGYSTIGDLFKFSLALQNGKLISLKMLEKMTSPEPYKHYGYGFQIGTGPFGKTFGHGGGFIGISSDLTILPSKGYTAIVLSNYSSAAITMAAKMKRLFQEIKD